MPDRHEVGTTDIHRSCAIAHAWRLPYRSASGEVSGALVQQVFLDKTWFGPVGRTLEERDAYLREKLSSVKGDSGELNRLQVPSS